MADPQCIVYCRCAYERLVPADVKERVLSALADSHLAFEAVPDLCELSARRDPALARWARSDGLRIVACHSRAVKWLFHAGGADLTDAEGKVLDMKQQSAEEILRHLRPDRCGEAAP